MSAQPSLLVKAEPAQVILPSNEAEVQVVRDRSVFGLGKYWAYFKDGTRELIGGPGGSQVGIQFEDEGVPLGTSGTVTEVDFTGAGVTATRVLNKVTVNIPTAPVVPQFAYFWQEVGQVTGTIAANNGKALWFTSSTNNSPLLTTVAGSGDVVVGAGGGGVYKINWEITPAEAGALALFINGVQAAGSLYGTGAGTQNIPGFSLLSLVDGDVVSLRTVNSPAALTLQLSGTTDATEVINAISFERVGTL